MERCKREGYCAHVTQEELGIAEEISRKGFWNDDVAGGVLSASYEDKYRLMVAGLKGIPQVVFLGAVDMINFWDLKQFQRSLGIDAPMSIAEAL
jgi:hypothetical protein